MIVLLGVVFLGFALQRTHEAYRPVAGHIDGRGLFAVFVVPPIAAVGGLLVVHGLLRSFRGDDRSGIGLVAYPGGALLALGPSLGYVLLYSGTDVSKRLVTYVDWFVVAFVIGLFPVGYVALRRLVATASADSNGR